MKSVPFSLWSGDFYYHFNYYYYTGGNDPTTSHQYLTSVVAKKMGTSRHDKSVPSGRGRAPVSKVLPTENKEGRRRVSTRTECIGSGGSRQNLSVVLEGPQSPVGRSRVVFGTDYTNQITEETSMKIDSRRQTNLDQGMVCRNYLRAVLPSSRSSHIPDQTDLSRTSHGTPP